MENYRKSSHTVYDIKYHIVLITMDYEIPQAHTAREYSREGAGFDPRDMQGERCRDHQRSHFSGSRAYIRIGTSTSIREPTGKVDQGEDIPQDDDGVQDVESSILGSSHMGTRVFCGQFRKCDRRGDHEIH